MSRNAVRLRIGSRKKAKKGEMVCKPPLPFCLLSAYDEPALHIDDQQVRAQAVADDTDTVRPGLQIQLGGLAADRDALGGDVVKAEWRRDDRAVDFDLWLLAELLAFD